MKSPLLLASLLAVASATAFAQNVNPKPKSATMASYPQELTDTGLNGAVEVDVTVMTDGSVANPQLAMATHRAFGRVAMETVSTWKFEPGMENGKAVERRVTIPFHFTAPPQQAVTAAVKRKVFVSLTEPVLGEADFPAKKLKVKRPITAIFPPGYRPKNPEETMQVKFVVGPDGQTFNPTVINSKNKELDMYAMFAVADASFEPPMKDKKPVYVEVTQTITFTSGFSGGGGNRGGGGGSRGGGGGGSRGGGGGGDGGGFGE